MELKCWLLFVRILNITGASLMVGFEIWFMVDLLRSDQSLLTTFVRMFTPYFVM